MEQNRPDDHELGVAKYLGPANEDGGGTFYLVEGTDGALYRMNKASGKMLKLVNATDWMLSDEVALKEGEAASVQQGVDQLEGRRVILSDDYPPDFLSKRLVEASHAGFRDELSSINKLADQGSKDEGVPIASFVPESTLAQDYESGVMPASEDIDDLRAFMSEKSDKLTEELQK